MIKTTMKSYEVCVPPRLMYGAQFVEKYFLHHMETHRARRTVSIEVKKITQGAVNHATGSVAYFVEYAHTYCEPCIGEIYSVQVTSMNAQSIIVAHTYFDAIILLDGEGVRNIHVTDTIDIELLQVHFERDCYGALARIL